MTVPPPRPALIRSDDGDVRPAVQHLSSLAVADEAVAKARKKARKKGRKRDPDKPSEETVTLVVALSKPDRKRLRRKAERYGWTPEEAASHVLQVWSGS
jgi:hypothetical protein